MMVLVLGLVHKHFMQILRILYICFGLVMVVALYISNRTLFMVQTRISSTKNNYQLLSVTVFNTIVYIKLCK